MEKIEKTLYYNSLYFIYKELFTDKQKKTYEMYYIYDLSFGEIADELKITRSAVEDSLKKVCAKLDEYENKLKLSEINQKMLEIIDNKNESTEKKLLKIKEILKNGI